ncbi:MAG: hypothetical protein QGG67_16365 [Gammaproteobacteria bacterium]|nr:hypothetical protein [Gammaproteobacteria bacterium]
MNAKASNRNKYSAYCEEHLKEFTDDLRDDASWALTSWPGRALALLLTVSSLLNYVDASGRDNPFALYILFAYTVPIFIVVLFPAATLFASTLEKYSPIVLDLLCLTGLISYCLALFFIFSGTELIEEFQSFSVLLSQVNFILLLSTAFSYHATYKITLVRNVTFAILLTIALSYIVPSFSSIIQIQVVQGILAGTLVSWVFFEAIRTRFYLKSTDADTRQHLYNQLSKLVYPHQLERIKLGDELESTMPLKEGKAIVNVFDVQRSGQNRHEKTADFFMGVFQAFLQICMKDYEHNPLRSRAFRLKETGDGFISSVGYPFLPIESSSMADSAVATALSMFEAFNLEVDKFNYSRPIKGAMGLAYNSVQGTFQSGGISSYDLFGEALI